ncbi:hypothetical protein QCA50_009790 [Cerrena zonata]|uniref:alpha-1,2-Mannosidase n=1 Tax=Cerrena zonata TaxID=2478898 RepID=A0AAW0G1D0_9APHY
MALVGRLRYVVPALFLLGIIVLGWPWFAPPPPHHFGPGSEPFHWHPHAPPPKIGPHHDSIWSNRALQVREAYLHAYQGYKTYALPHDELLPLSNKPVDNFNGWGLTLIDGLDTMWIMGLYSDFYDSLAVISEMTFSLKNDSYAPFFETVIRYLGGLLSAYALSHEPILLAKADDLGKMLLPAFNTSTGLPMYAVNTVTGDTRLGWAAGTVLWSEALSCQLEYKYLAHLTGRQQYFDNVEKIMDIMREVEIEEGKFPTKWSHRTGRPSNDQFSVGAFADSAHEYLLKQWLMTARTESKARDLYLRVVESILKDLLYLSPTRNLLYVTDTNRNIPSHVMEHLSCFLPGLLTLGANTLPLPPRERQLHSWAAQGLAQTCWLLYADHASGLAPDEVMMSNTPHSGSRSYTVDNPSHGYTTGKWLEHIMEWEKHGSPGAPPGLEDIAPAVEGPRDYASRKPGYYLRPETVESFYLMWRTTGDERWRDRGWAVFQAIQRETKTSSGYASVSTVEQSPASKLNEMPSFFMAETLKYLYLLFTDEELIPLDQWVFNT